MSKAVEETVQTEATTDAAAPTGQAAFDAARATIADSGKEATADDTSKDAKPSEDPEKVADQTQEPTETTDALLTTEQLAAMSPKERQQAEKWQTKLTQESQRQAAQRKELEGLLPLVEALKANPAAALEEIAKKNGLTLTRAAVQDTKTVETHAASALADIPEELQFLKPVFESYGKKLMETLRGEIAPIKEAHTAMVSEAAAAETQSTMEAFTAKYPEWKKHEVKMLEIGAKFIPTAGAMTDFEYMETLHKLATSDQSKAEQTKTLVEKINKSAASVEPSGSGVPNERVEHALPPPDKRSMRDAFAAAKNGIRWADK